MRTSRAVVQTAPRALEMRELPLPEIGADDGLLRVEACGICGSDYEQYQGGLPVRFPVIPGHEPVGRIAEIGDIAAKRWGVQAGDRVCVETLIPCGHCRECLQPARYRLCTGAPARFNAYGYLGLDVPPGLWGGYADYLYLDPARHRPQDRRRPSRRRSPRSSTRSAPASAGPSTCRSSQPGEYDRHPRPGPARPRLRHRRERGRRGPHHRHRPRRATRTSSPSPASSARTTPSTSRRKTLRTVRPREQPAAAARTLSSMSPPTPPRPSPRRSTSRAAAARVVLAGTKGPKPVPDFYSDRLVMKELTLIGALGVDYAELRLRAIRLIESRQVPAGEDAHAHPAPDRGRARPAPPRRRRPRRRRDPHRTGPVASLPIEAGDAHGSRDANEQEPRAHGEGHRA